MHMHFDESFNAGILPIMTVGEPGAQGALVAGTQGIGVKTPSAAEVAEATVGLAMDEHMPKVGIFAMGLKSMMLAAGAPHIVLFKGGTMSAAGATPKLHVIIAPAVTSFPIDNFRLRFDVINHGCSDKSRTISSRRRDVFSLSPGMRASG